MAFLDRGPDLALQAPPSYASKVQDPGCRDQGLKLRQYRVYIRVIWELYRDNGKENGNYYSIIGYILRF